MYKPIAALIASVLAVAAAAADYPAKPVRLVVPYPFRERMVSQGAEPAGGTPEQWGAFLRSEIVKWAKIARAAGLKDE